FTGVDGEPGVDNQLYRAIGCTKYRGNARRDYPHIYSDPFLIDIRGVDDPRNDDHVEVGISSTDDVPLEGSDGRALARQTLGPSRNARWRASTGGRLV